jgi:hypothetical protein
VPAEQIQLQPAGNQTAKGLGLQRGKNPIVRNLGRRLEVI